MAMSAARGLHIYDRGSSERFLDLDELITGCGAKRLQPLIASDQRTPREVERLQRLLRRGWVEEPQQKQQGQQAAVVAALPPASARQLLNREVQELPPINALRRK